MSEPSYLPGSGLNRRSARLLSGLAGLSAVALLTAWWYTTHANPIVNIPNPVLPTPNAFDFYVKAGDAITGTKQINEADTDRPTVRYTLAQKEAIVRQNADVIDTLHTGFASSYLNPPNRSFSTDTAYYSKFRMAAHLLSLQGQVRAEEGDWGGAAESYLDAMRMGADIPHGSPISGALIGISCQSIGRRQMGKIVEHLNAEQSRAAAKRLAGIMDRHVPFADSIQEEKWQVQAELMELFENRLPQPTSTETQDDSAGPRAFSMAELLYFFASKKRIMHDFTAYMDQSAQQARRPYSLHLPPPHEPTDIINMILLPVFMNSRLGEVNCETQNGFLLVSLALHAYRLEHGYYPATLTELTSGYLSRLPVDPFTGQGTFKYRVKGKSYTLYSVGPDGKDDGGKPIDDPKRIVGSHPESRYNIHDNSLGDVVAGKNTW